MDDHATVAPASSKPWLFAKGNTEYRARKDRITERVAALAADYVADSALAQQLLEIAAIHLDSAARARNSVLRSRATRMATKVLGQLERKPKPQPTLDELLKDVW
jgi:hypothetical protein